MSIGIGLIKGRHRIEPPEGMEKFQCDDSLVHHKLLSYLPFMVATNLATMLLSIVDGFVVGNLVGKEALAAISIFMPIALVISIVSILVSTGISSALSTSMSSTDIDDIAPLKRASRIMMIVSALVVAIIEFPVATVLIRSYHLTPEMKEMVWQYGIGVLTSLPLGLVSTICVYELTVLGKKEVLTWLAVMEGGINLVLDLVFVGAFHMGIAGAGWGTATANLVRCTVSILYLSRNTDIYRCGGAKLRIEDILRIFRLGTIDASFTAMMAVQGVIMLRLLLTNFGESGGVINGVCRFCMIIINVAIMSIQASARPFFGIFSGAKDIAGIRMLLRRSVLLVLALVSPLILLVVLFPSFFYHLNGVQEIPPSGLLCLRLYMTHLIFRGFNSIFRLYFAGRGDSKFSSSVTIVSYLTLPVFGFLLSMIYTPAFWLAYLLTEFVLFFLNAVHYASCVQKDMQKEVPEEAVLYLTVAPKDAIEASRGIRRYAQEHKYPERLAYRASLCLEEMIHYSVSVNGDSKVRNQIMIKFLPDSCIFTILDDGRCIMLDETEETKELITNYKLIKKVATSVRYQYLLNLNYTVITFV